LKGGTGERLARAYRKLRPNRQRIENVARSGM
jgi:hypothetical protein